MESSLGTRLHLFLDCSTSLQWIGLCEQNGALLNWLHWKSHPSDSSHSETLIETVDQILLDAQKVPSEVAQLHFNIGPGSFTGVRVGVNFAKAWGFSQPSLQLSPFTSFDLLDRCDSERRWVPGFSKYWYFWDPNDNQFGSEWLEEEQLLNLGINMQSVIFPDRRDQIVLMGSHFLSQQNSPKPKMDWKTIQPFYIRLSEPEEKLKSFESGSS